MIAIKISKETSSIMSLIRERHLVEIRTSSSGKGSKNSKLIMNSRATREGV